MRDDDYFQVLRYAVDAYDELRETVESYRVSRPLLSQWAQVDGQPKVVLDVKLNKPVPDALHRRVKDISGYLRSALNFATLRLTSGLSASQRKKIQFPIYQEQQGDWVERTESCLRGLSSEKKEFVETVQPYKHPDGSRAEPLYWLSEIDNENKHRGLVRVDLPADVKASLETLHVQASASNLESKAQEVAEKGRASLLRFRFEPVKGLILSDEWQRAGVFVASPGVKLEGLDVEMKLETKLMIVCGDLQLPILSSIEAIQARVEGVVDSLLAEW